MFTKDKIMRTKKSVKNLIYAFIGQFAAIIISLISRFVFVRMLTAEYLGLSRIIH